MRARVAFAAAVIAVSAGCTDGSGTSAPTSTARVAQDSSVPVAATELVVGDCLGQVAVGARERALVQSVRLVSCEGEHELEVFATFELDPAQLETDPPGAYPGQERVVSAADAGCTVELHDLVDARTYGLIALWPSVESWQSGDRTVACAAYLVDGTPFPARQLVADA